MRVHTIATLTKCRQNRHLPGWGVSPGTLAWRVPELSPGTFPAGVSGLSPGILAWSVPGLSPGTFQDLADRTHAGIK